ncbi:unnamed protein product [Tilletia controversa]|uniref:Membrane anchor Opy2 N-terminal domain-containing protein n=3 Tax=Tilletia TaxID=13289 RepID=A0A8X7SWV1_9BASI|nr:hypothetical protein CF336_g7725 [Tilletia laevis]KAE8197944.1 hypothetical protein CF328_g3693 [Tilletia controversa]KAE8261366.1 hypothetical protein A4X03_0g3325 [Tilletia caries]KAE8187156.1 hypothetical protein CF335_g7253 [Tilletia laevis]KAE8247455.1 hypothetical protein A4X06_0g4437 [Tilletia controversa]
MESSALAQSKPRMVLVARADSQCCPAGFSPEPCRGCNPNTQRCNQYFPTNCQCAYNVCENITSSPANSPAGGAGSGALGGALGGVLGALAIALALFLFWRHKRQRAKLLQARMKADAKVRAAAAEKFRPGREGAISAASGGPASANTTQDRRLSQQSSKRSVQTLSIGHASNLLGSGPSSANNNNNGTSTAIATGTGTGRKSPLDPFVDPADDEDTEWTELRADGLTTFKNPADANNLMDNEEEEMLDGLGALVNRRHSTGAATHLSRITEGNEDDEDERRSLAPTVRDSFRLSAHAPPMPFDAVSIAQQAAGMLSSAPASLRPLSAYSSQSGASVGRVTTASPQNNNNGGGAASLLNPRMNAPSNSSSSSNRLSTLTTATGLSMASSIGDYVISMSQSISPQAPRRVQLGQERPTLVRTLSHEQGQGQAEEQAEGSGEGNGKTAESAAPTASLVSYRTADDIL